MSTSSKMLTLKSLDGEAFDVEEAAALQSETIKHMIEDDCADTAIPLPNVKGAVLAKVVEYLKKHAETPPKGNDDEEGKAKEAADALKDWDDKFVKELDLATLFDIILAGNYLSIKGLMDLTCQKVADHIKDMSPEQIRETFNIKNDFTPDEEKKIREENQWAFE